MHILDDNKEEKKTERSREREKNMRLVLRKGSLSQLCNVELSYD